jgi:hypothetical protein
MTRAIGQLFTQDERTAFVAAARTFDKVRWRHQGRDARGVDCAGLVIVSLIAVGRNPVDAIGYGKIPYRGMLEELIERNLGDPLPLRQDMREGDVVLLKFTGEPCHVGIITDYLYGGFSLLHAYASNRCVVEHRFNASWFDNIAEVYRP